MPQTYTLPQKIRFHIAQYQKQTSDPAELAFLALTHFVDMYHGTYYKEFKEIWQQADFYWVIIHINISNYGKVKWKLSRGYDFPLSMNPNYIAKEIIGAIEEVVQILNEKFPELQFQDEERYGNRSNRESS